MSTVPVSVFMATALHERIISIAGGESVSQLFCKHWPAFYSYADAQSELPELLPGAGRQAFGISVSADINDEICRLATRFNRNKSVVLRNCFQFICDQVNPPEAVAPSVDPLLRVIGKYLIRPDRERFADDVIQVVTAGDRESSRSIPSDGPPAVVPSSQLLIEFIDQRGVVSVDAIRKHFWAGCYEHKGLAGGLGMKLRRLAETGQLVQSEEPDGTEVFRVPHEPQTDEESIIRVIAKGGWVNAEYLIRHLYLDTADDELKQVALGRVYGLTDKGVLKARVKSDNKLQWSLINGQED